MMALLTAVLNELQPILPYSIRREPRVQFHSRKDSRKGIVNLSEAVCHQC